MSDAAHKILVRNVGPGRGAFDTIPHGAEGLVDPENPGVRIALRAGSLIRVDGSIPMPSDATAPTAAEAAALVQEIDRRGREAGLLRTQVTDLQAQLAAAKAAEAAAKESARASANANGALAVQLDALRAELKTAQGRVAELDALLAQATAPAQKPAEGDAASKAVGGKREERKG